MDSDHINEAVEAISEQEDLIPDTLVDCGKIIPYFGWFWRRVDFDQRITLAYADGIGFDEPGWVGFCENNKWGHAEFLASVDESAKIRGIVEALVTAPTKERATAVYEYLQSLCPKG